MGKGRGGREELTRPTLRVAHTASHFLYPSPSGPLSSAQYWPRLLFLEQHGRKAERPVLRGGRQVARTRRERERERERERVHQPPRVSRGQSWRRGTHTLEGGLRGVCVCVCVQCAQLKTNCRWLWFVWTSKVPVSAVPRFGELPPSLPPPPPSSPTALLPARLHAIGFRHMVWTPSLRAPFFSLSGGCLQSHVDSGTFFPSFLLVPSSGADRVIDVLFVGEE